MVVEDGATAGGQRQAAAPDVLLCDFHQLFAQSLAGALRAAGLTVVLTSTTREAIDRARDSHPRLCILALRFPEGAHAGLKALPILRLMAPTTPLLILGSAISDQQARAALEAGADAALAKSIPLATLMDTVSDLLGQHRRTKQGPAHREVAPLSRREREVLALLSEGSSMTELIGALDVQPSTARGHVQEVLRKLEVHSRLEATASPAAARLRAAQP